MEVHCHACVHLEEDTTTYIVNIEDVTTFDVDVVVETDGKLGNLPVNWPKLWGPFQNGLSPVFDVYVFGISFCIIVASGETYNLKNLTRVSDTLTYGGKKGPCIYRFSFFVFKFANEKRITNSFFVFRFQICERKTKNEFLFRFSFSKVK